MLTYGVLLAYDIMLAYILRDASMGFHANMPF